MACGTPVLSSTQAVSALDADPGRDVLVASDADAFARQILHLLAHRRERESIGQAGRRYVEAHHRWDSIVARLEHIYQEVSNSQNGHIPQN
jgi:glycosyltransferase involved in cell wall biosynthesis